VGGALVNNTAAAVCLQQLLSMGLNGDGYLSGKFSLQNEEQQCQQM
jgi:hypothetical protein